MGQEIQSSDFAPEHFAEFQRRLTAETELLRQWIQSGELDNPEFWAGCELEAWLTDNAGNPAAINQRVLDRLDSELVVPELSAFNIELNSEPRRLNDKLFDLLHTELDQLFGQCETCAQSLDAHLLMIGILPTVRQADLCLANISPLQRYQALNEQIFRLRQGRPIRLDIDGRESLHLSHEDVMLEAATTSFQLHLQVGANQAARAFNAAKILSAPMVAICANSPFLFGRDLWEETRIPLFEQAIAVGGSDYSKRVTFGIRYARNSIIECFEANRDRYPVLLPQLLDEPPENLAHLRLHNGTVWRWNRPLLGFSAEGSPHVRIEHRVIPAGPTVLDMVANSACFFGAMVELISADADLEQRLPFATAAANFYAAARDGLSSEVTWFDGQQGQMRDLCQQQILPLAEAGLKRLGSAPEAIDPWLNIVRQRVTSGRTGSCWQRQWIDQHGRDFQGLTLAYLERQRQGQPVHSWEV